MSEWPALALAWMLGTGLGTMFFGGLWWTVRQVLTSKRPALYLLASMILRTSMALIGFYFIGHEDWRHLIACLVGFIMARLVVTWLTRPPEQTRPAPEASRAP